MANDSKIYSPEEKYKLIGKLIEEVKLRRYSYQIGKSYISMAKDFLSSGKTPREFLLSYTTKSKPTMRSAHFALKFFHENVLNTGFEEKLPLARKSLKLPLILSKEILKNYVRTTSKQLLGARFLFSLKLQNSLNHCYLLESVLLLMRPQF